MVIFPRAMIDYHGFAWRLRWDLHAISWLYKGIIKTGAYHPVVVLFYLFDSFWGLLWAMYVCIIFMENTVHPTIAKSLDTFCGPLLALLKDIKWGYWWYDCKYYVFSFDSVEFIKIGNCKHVFHLTFSLQTVFRLPPRQHFVGWPLCFDPSVQGTQQLSVRWGLRPPTIPSCQSQLAPMMPWLPWLQREHRLQSAVRHHSWRRFESLQLLSLVQGHARARSRGFRLYRSAKFSICFQCSMAGSNKRIPWIDGNIVRTKSVIMNHDEALRASSGINCCVAKRRACTGLCCKASAKSINAMRLDGSRLNSS